MLRRYRRFTALLTSLLLAACGSAPVAQRPAAAPTTGTPQSAPAAATVDGAASIAPAMVQDEAGQPQTLHQVPGFAPFSSVSMFDVLGERDAGILVRHGYGETVVPGSPQRIFAADEPTLEILLALGLRPAGGVYTVEPPADLQPLLQGVELIPAPNDTLNLEAVARLQPDLILGYGYLGYNEDRALWEKFNTIAPTVSFLADPYSLLWQQATRDVAALFGIAERAEQVLADYERETTLVRDTIRQRIGDETVAVIEARPEGIQLYSPGYYLNNLHMPYFTASWAFVELQLVPASEVQALATQKDFFGSATLSLEQLPTLQAAHLFAFNRGIEGGREALDTVTTQPIWQTVPAVQHGDAYVLPNAVLGVGPYSSRAFLNQVAEVVGRAPAR